MEQSNTQQTPQGKGMGVAGFVISLVALVFYFVIAIVVAGQALLGGGYGLGIFWLILCIAGTGLSVMAMMKLGKTGGKKGLAITGMILGLVATIFTIMLVMGISKAQQAGDMFGDKFKKEMEKGLNQSMDSLSKAAAKSIDSVANQH